MEQLGSYWTDYREILYLSMFRKFVEKTQVSLKSNKNNRYNTRRPMYLYDNKGKGLPQQAEVALGVPGRLRPRIISTFGTTRPPLPQEKSLVLIFRG
jgi:hypothetical protein